jgi:hypothetical protein
VPFRSALYRKAEKRYPRSGAFEAHPYQGLNERAELLPGVAEFETAAKSDRP